MLLISALAVLVVAAGLTIGILLGILLS